MVKMRGDRRMDGLTGCFIDWKTLLEKMGLVGRPDWYVPLCFIYLLAKGRVGIRAGKK